MYSDLAIAALALSMFAYYCLALFMHRVPVPFTALFIVIWVGSFWYLLAESVRSVLSLT